MSGMIISGSRRRVEPIQASPLIFGEWLVEISENIPPRRDPPEEVTG
jgi:hypothetical protein